MTRVSVSSIRRDERGAIALMFALLLIPLLIAAGVAIDLLRAGQIRAQLSEATDAGLLAGARLKNTDTTATDAEATVVARRYFDANGDASVNVTIDTFDFEEDTAAEAYRLTVTGEVKTTLLGLVGVQKLDIDILAEAKLAPPRLLEVVMVLDTTGSMAGQKIQDLKDAAKKLTDGIMSDTATNVKVGVIPFARYVNVGLSRRYESWIDVPPDSSTTEYKCWNTYPNKTTSNCVTTTQTCSSTNDGVTSTWTCNKTTCDTDWGDPVEVCGDVTNNTKWYGCVGSRNNPFDVKDDNFTTSRVPGLMNTGCAEELLPMTSSKAAVTAKLDSLSASGDTYIPAGLTWGLRAISSIAPFTEGETYTNIEMKKGMKALILMTDGANTRSATYPEHNGSDAAAADARTDDLCKEAKKERIVMYTIAFDVSDAGVKTMLRNCASAPANFYDASDAADLARAFEEIANNLQELALTK